MAFTVVSYTKNQTAAAGTTLDGDAVLAIAANDLLVGVFAWKGEVTDSPSCYTDGPANQFTMLTPTKHSVTGKCMVMGYKIGAAADASATVTFALGQSDQYRSFTVVQLRPADGATVSFEADAGNKEMGYTAAYTTNTLSVNGSDIVTFFGIEDYSNVALSAMTVDGNAATVPYVDTYETFLGRVAFDTNKSNISGAATMGGDTRGITNLIAFNATAGGGGPSILPLIMALMRRRL
jgi:hypothetical protein